MKRIVQYKVEIVKDKSGLYELESKKIRSPHDGYVIIEEVLSLSTKTNEHFIMLALNAKNEVIGVHTMHIGNINSSIVCPRSLFQSAFLNNACSIIVAHNHPSNDLTPSQEDIQVTARLVDCGKLLGIELLDHLIIGDKGFTSLKEKGYF